MIGLTEVHSFTFQGLASLAKSSTKGRSSEIWTEGLKALQGLHHFSICHGDPVLILDTRPKIQTTGNLAAGGYQTG